MFTVMQVFPVMPVFTAIIVLPVMPFPVFTVIIVFPVMPVFTVMAAIAVIPVFRVMPVFPVMSVFTVMAVFTVIIVLPVIAVFPVMPVFTVFPVMAVIAAGARVPKLGKMKHRAHDMQSVTVSNHSFVLEREVAAHGLWSQFESIVFIHCVKHLETNFMERTDSTVTALYNTVVEYLSAAYCTLQLPQHPLLRIKTATQCAAKLLHFEREQQMFKEYSSALYEHQLTFSLP